MNNNEIVLHLSLINGIGPLTVWRILQIFNTDELYLLYNLSSLEIGFKFGLTPKISSLIYSGLKDKTDLIKELDLIKKNSINWITLIDDEYPQILKNSYLPPLVLYYQGANIFNEKSIAVVGSRKINAYGFKAMDHIVPQLVSNSWVIVSGGAIGADTRAHELALKSLGKTIVILGSGLLKPYPYSNRQLFKQIINSGGAIVSSFPLLTEPFPGNFPARNRIIAGLSKGCLVVQAAIKSGTRITATYALEQGKEVFAIPGPIDDELSAGCHSLIKEGAKLVHTVEDIFTEFGEVGKENIELVTLSKASALSKKGFISSYYSETPTPPFVVSVCEANVSNHDGSEDDLLKLCSRIPLSIEDLIEKTGFTLPELQAKLFELELEDKIKQDFSGMWQIR